MFRIPITTLCFLLASLIVVSCEAKEEENVKIDKQYETPVRLIAEGDFGSARVRVRQHMDKHGEHSQGCFIMGLSYHNEKRYSKAAQWFARATEFQGEVYSPAWHFLGWAHYYLGNVYQSKDAFQRFLILQNGEPDSMFALGLLEMNDGNSQKAMHWFQRSINKCKGNQQLMQGIASKSFARMSDVLESQGRTDEAIVMYLRAIELNPRLYEVYHRLSNIYRKRGELQLAENAQKQFFITRDIVRPELKHTSFPE